MTQGPDSLKPQDDSRPWEAICAESDMITARLVCTYLEAEDIETRVTELGGRFHVEVPTEYYEMALRVHGAEGFADGPSAPVVHEVTRPTSIKTVRRMREALASRGIKVGPPPAQFTPPPRRLKLAWLFVLTLVLAAAVMSVLILLVRR